MVSAEVSPALTARSSRLARLRRKARSASSCQSVCSTELRAPPSVRTLKPLLRGELRLGTCVTRISPAAHLAELANGHRIIYDKLLSTLSLPSTLLLVKHDLPHHVRRDESLRYWLCDHDIELADRATQEFYGDIDEFAGGRRAADRIGQDLAAKFGNAGRSRARSSQLFRPRLVMQSTP